MFSQCPAAIITNAQSYISCDWESSHLLVSTLLAGADHATRLDLAVHEQWLFVEHSVDQV